MEELMVESGEAESMDPYPGTMVLELQRLEFADEDSWFGNSCTSSYEACCQTNTGS
jgi:hypothetical protein